MNTSIKIAVDLDGVICEDKKPYALAKPKTKAILMVRLLAEKGKVIIYTARREKDRELTLRWLRNHKVPFYKLVMGKVKADAYVDDKNTTLEELCKK